MAKRENEIPVLSAHHIYQSKKGKTECPGCSQIFGKRHFENHKLKFFVEDTWTCNVHKITDQEVTGDIQDTVHQNEPSTSTASDDAVQDRPLITIIRERLKSLHPCEDGNQTEDEDEEFWNNLRLEDIDADFYTRTNDDQSKNLASEGINPLFICLCLFLCSWQAYHVLPDAAIQNLLMFLSEFFNLLSAENVALTSVVTIFPASVYKLYKNLGYQKDDFNKLVVCKKCYETYKYEDCFRIVEGQQIPLKCRKIHFPNHRQEGRRKACGQLLLKVVRLQSGIKLYPYKTFCYKSVESSLKGLVNLPQFEKDCEKWRSRRQEDGFLADIYDGKVWKEFNSSEKNNFLSTKNNYGLMLNLDWFQPYEHVRYSIGIMYAVVLNLPRQERFKLRNVILIGVIPDMDKEPTVPTFVEPFVNELKHAWNEGFQFTSHESPKEPQQFKLALMCVGCDIPATRKLCGFLGHGATLGCSKCMKSFPGEIGKKNYGGFNTTEWEPRNIEQHKQQLAQIKNATTQTDKLSLESRYGLRYSPLWDLEYFDPVRMSIVDPMHNFYQGTAKKMIKLWLELKIILPEQLQEIQKRVDSVNAASNIGAIPNKIACSFGGFTAEQWKNWTNVFSIFALIDILPSEDLEVWRKFVLASSIMTSKHITEPEIRQFHSLIKQFCTKFEEKYGQERVTPNMHLHCHVADCIRDYGPVYSFWLFSFERYNGHLGSLPKNNRSIEVQIMRRFSRDFFVNCLELPELFKQTFLHHFTQMNKNETLDDVIVPDDEIRQLLYMSKRSAPIANQNWSNIEAYYISKSSTHCLNADEHRIIKQTYNAMYPNLTNMVIPESCRKCTSVALRKEIFGSWDSRHQRSSFVMAYWHSVDGSILSETGTGDLIPGIVRTYYLHNLIIQNESRVHLFAKVNWLQPMNNRIKNYCGKPVEIWTRDLFDIFGPSAFIPIQRICCKFVKADGNIFGKNVSFICPLNNRMNI